MINTNSCINCTVSNCFIKSCYPNWIQRIAKKKTAIHYEKGQYIFNAGHSVRGIYFIKNGKVKVVSSGLRGKEQIVRLASDGHILGHRGFGGETYPISAIAMDDSVICFVDNDTIYEAFYNNLQFLLNLMMFYSKELRGIEERMTFMAQMTVREKVASALLYLKDIFGYESYERILNITISRADIASLCGTNVEQVICNLTDFEKEKLIQKEGKKIRITNEGGLRKMMDLHD